MALIPVGAVDYKTALVAARIAFTSTTAGAVTGDRRGLASKSVTVSSGAMTITLAAAQLVGLADIIVVSSLLATTATGHAGCKRCAPVSVNTTTGAVVLQIITDDGTSGIPAYGASADGDTLHLTLMLVYNQE